MYCRTEPRTVAEVLEVCSPCTRCICPSGKGPEAAAAPLGGPCTLLPIVDSGTPIIRGRRLAVEHVLGMLAAGDDADTILLGYPWLEREDVLACIEYARRLVSHEYVEPFEIEKKSA